MARTNDPGDPGSETAPDETTGSGEPAAAASEPARSDEGGDPDEVAARVVVSYPADLSEWGRWQLDEHSFKSYLRRVYDTVTPGDEWEVFLDVGCCGSTLDVPLRVEDVADGDRMGEDTDVAYEEREACGLEGGWAVQSNVES